MEPTSSLNLGAPPDLNVHYRLGCGQDHFSDGPHYGRKKSKVRLNDQLIPKPTDINMAEKVMKTATPKEHPYSSHISRFAMFPSFRCPDDPDTGVRAASRPFPHPLIPNCAPDVTVLSKTIGSPYRHEILMTPQTRERAAVWTGEHGFWDHPKPLRGENQMFYPTPPKTVLPNPKLRAWDLSLSERSSNMLRNLERSHWLTSYQMHYTGSGPANPLKIDDFKEKISDLSGMNSHSAPLREKSYPGFVPSKPRKEWRRRQEKHNWRNPTAAVLPNPPPLPDHSSSPAAADPNRPQEIIAQHNEATGPKQTVHSQSKLGSGSAEAHSSHKSQEVLHKQPTEHKSAVCAGRDRENSRVRFDESVLQESLSQSSGEAEAVRLADSQKPLGLCSYPPLQGENREESPVELHKKEEPSVRKESFTAERSVWDRSEPDAGLLSEQEQASLCDPRPPVLPGLHPRPPWTVAGEGAALSLLELQNSFSKTMAHHNFNSSVTRAAVDLRDNVTTGKKHNFFGINCNYLHG